MNVDATKREAREALKRFDRIVSYGMSDTDRADMSASIILLREFLLEAEKVLPTKAPKKQAENSPR